VEVAPVDVAIVGAGPGGLYAAIEALKRGLKVHVFDKKEVIGSPVKCGEYFPIRKEMEYLLPNAGEYMNVFDVPREAVDNVCKTIRVISPKGSEYEFEFVSFVLNRTILEQGLAKEVERLGGTIQLRTAAELYVSNRELNVGRDRASSIKARTVIAADGFPSKVAKAGGILTDDYMTPNNVAINYEHLVTELSIDQSVTEMYLGTDIAPGGYGWIIPKGNRTANVGVGIRTPYSKRNNGREYLEFFLHNCSLTEHKLKGGRLGPIIADVLPIDGPLGRTFSEHVMAVGDAACMVMPTNGGGIATAMITGSIAGQVAADHLQINIPLSDYERRWREVMGLEMAVSTKLRRLADRFMGHDFAFHVMLRILGSQGIKDVIACKVPRVLKFLMR
jgi:digeranylgeranylglycerophospholipid reductase